MRKRILPLLLIALLPVACAPELGHDEYSMERPGELSARILMGKVTGAEPVTVRSGDKGQRAMAGGGGGALVGGLLGSAIGSGSGNTGTGALVGALAGGTGGALLGGATGSSKAWRITVITDGGEEIVSVAKDRLYRGTRVRVEVPTGGGRVRFVPVG